MELKNGETYNGHLVSCDTWMNINLREVICTSKVSLKLVNKKDPRYENFLHLINIFRMVTNSGE